MKKNKLILLYILLVFPFFTACDDDDDGASNTPASTEVGDTLLSGTWIIETLIDDGEDETADYANYVLSFSGNLQVVATHTTDSNLTRQGTYLVFEDDGKIELEMLFVNANNIDDLNDDWYLVSASDNTLVWDDSGDVLILSQQ
jgi:hypothetical protein